MKTLWNVLTVLFSLLTTLVGVGLSFVSIFLLAFCDHVETFEEKRMLSLFFSLFISSAATVYLSATIFLRKIFESKFLEPPSTFPDDAEKRRLKKIKLDTVLLFVLLFLLTLIGTIIGAIFIMMRY